MSTDKTWEIVSNSLEDTFRLAEKIGQRLKGGEVIELASDIGGGKTAFVRGLATGIKSSDQVASPTFTISRHYRAAEGDLVIHHFDFYRLNEDPGLMKAEIAESTGSPGVVTVVEWADSIADVLPEDRLKVEIISTGEDSRHIRFLCGKDHQHLEVQE